MHLPKLERTLRRFRPSETEVLIILSIVVGSATAVGAIAFIALIEHFNELFFGLTDQMLAEAVGDQPLKFWLPIIPILGGLLVGPIVYKFASEAKGHGVPEVMNAVARLGGIIRPRVAAAKTLASAICIGSGGSAGREGPIVQIGSAIGSTIGQAFRMSGNRIKILVGCGAAAGISSVFNAPIAGVIFSMEIILGDYAITTFAPVILSSVVASVVTRSVLGNYPAFDVPSYSLVSAAEIPLYILMGVLLGVLGVVFTKVLDFFEDAFERLKFPNMLKPALGGLLLGILAIFYPQVLADGYETIRLTLYGQISAGLLVILVVAKLAATSFTLGSGNSGGIFAPSLFMGAVAGGAFGSLVHTLLPSYTATPGAYALVGMAGMVAAATHAPITALLIIFEMTSDYRIILPLMVTVVFSALVARRLFGHSIYTAKLAKRGIEIRGGRDINVLKSHTVREVMDEEFSTIPASMQLPEILQKVEESDDTYFVVIGRTGQLKGVFTLQDLRSILSHPELNELVVAQDLAPSYTTVIHPDVDLDEANRIFGYKGLTMIPVVSRIDDGKVIGVLRRDKLIDHYNKRLLDTLQQ
ncbi:CBS domain-containing protein [candidate division GN15 bacterium]|nr:CBS domain-containing protein [candidate division GN15 bacterium]